MDILSTLMEARDRERLRGVHPHLVRVVERAARSERLMVIEGLRTRDRQAALVASGALALHAGVDVAATVALLFRPGSPRVVGRPARSAAAPMMSTPPG